MEKNTKVLFEDFTLHRYLVAEHAMYQITHSLKRGEYLMLIYIAHTSKEREDGKIYLKEIAEEVELPMSEVSADITALRDNGYVKWTHDGMGEQGTYVVMTDIGRDMLAENRKHLADFYQRVIDEYGYEELISLVDSMKSLENTMHKVHDEMASEKEK
jgi:DNA-binding MarR family transcriptional regulator